MLTQWCNMQNQMEIVEQRKLSSLMSPQTLIRMLMRQSSISFTRWSNLQIKEIIENPNHTKLEITFDNARNFKSKEFLYGATKALGLKYPHLKLLRWVPLCPCHGKTDLDRRFSSVTSWVNTFHRNERIGSVEKMTDVLNEGIKGSNKRRREIGKTQFLRQRISLSFLLDQQLQIMLRLTR